MSKKSKKDDKKKKKKGKKSKAYGGSSKLAAFASVNTLEVTFHDDGMGQLTADVVAEVVLNEGEELDGNPKLIVTDVDADTELLNVDMDQASTTTWEKLGILPGSIHSGTTYEFKVIVNYVIKIKASTSSSVVRTVP